MSSAGHHSMMSGEATGIPYIMPDGGAYWDTGFKGGSGCEYVFDCLWKTWPRNVVDGVRVANEYVLLGGHIYTGVIVCTFNWQAQQKDTLTIQASRTEVRTDAPSDMLNIRSTLRCKMRVGDNYLRIGFDGGSTASVYKSSLSADSTNLILCSHAMGGGFDGSTRDPMPDDTVLIFSVDIYQNGSLAKRFVPALDGSTPCFLEEVGGSYVHSSGSTAGKYGLYKG